MQTVAGVQSTALVDAVSVHLVEQGPEAHAEPLGRVAAVARRCRQGGGDGLALPELHGVTQRAAAERPPARAPGPWGGPGGGGPPTGGPGGAENRPARGP